ncbi:hypothetical protein [Halobacteriovorax sp. HLS]|uniref:hypothetical protein n=1 Tax=Halobacteriovorax sp. HLS TaxID=2234000 RepID=UPI000FD75FC1|nr:hypothetical protein [Halobacteriovorax sp. HLS]
MKKILGFTAVATMGLVSTTALASKARILALGEEVEDNYFIEDNRSIFTNAAYINNYADTLTLEWGGTGATSGGTLDQDADPKAMGGFLKKTGNFTYGLYLGNESNVSSFLRILASPTGTYLSTADNQIDLFLGSETASGIKWGANFVYTKDSNEPATAGAAAYSEDNAMAVRLGALADQWEGYVNLSLDSKSEKKNLTVPSKFDGKFGLQVGGSYKISDYKLYASYKTFSWDQTGGNQSAGVKSEGKFNRLFVGAGKSHKINSTDTVSVRAYYDVLNVEMKYTADKSELSRTALPVIATYEANATSWLTLRGSVSYNLVGQSESKRLSKVVNGTYSNGAAVVDTLKGLALASYNGSMTDGKTTISNGTAVNAGASLLFGDLTIDGFIGTTAASRAATTSAKQGVLALDNLLTRVGMTYNF